jgi:hypothetical protein
LRTDSETTLKNLSGIGLVRWSDVAAALTAVAERSPSMGEQLFAQQALQWLRGRSIAAE